MHSLARDIIPLNSHWSFGISSMTSNIYGLSKYTCDESGKLMHDEHQEITFKMSRDVDSFKGLDGKFYRFSREGCLTLSCGFDPDSIYIVDKEEGKSRQNLGFIELDYSDFFVEPVNSITKEATIYFNIKLTLGSGYFDKLNKQIQQVMKFTVNEQIGESCITIATHSGQLLIPDAPLGCEYQSLHVPECSKLGALVAKIWVNCMTNA